MIYKSIRRYWPLVLVICAFSNAFAESTNEIAQLKTPIALSLHKESNGISLHLTSKSKCSFQYLETGFRAVFDCAGISIPKNLTISPLDNQFVKLIRIGSYPDKLRLVADLKIEQHPKLEIVSENSKFIYKLSFAGISAPTAAIQKPIVTSSPVATDENLNSEVEEEKRLGTPPLAPKIISGKISPTPEPTEVVPVRKVEKPAATAAPTPEPTPTATPTEIPTSVPTTIPSSTPRTASTESVERPLGVENLDIKFNEGDRFIKDVVVTNLSSSPLLVNVDTYPAAGSTLAKGLDVVKDTLTPSPRKFTLGPGQKRAIRLLLSISNERKESEEDIQFKVRFSDEHGEEVAPQIDVSYVPKSFLPKLVATPINGKLKLKNKGTSVVHLSSGKCCRSTECQPVSVTKLNAGESILLDLPEDCRLEFIHEDSKGFNRFFVERELDTNAVF